MTKNALLLLLLAAPVRAQTLILCRESISGMSPCMAQLVSPSTVNLNLDEKCLAPNCQRDFELLVAANPDECLVDPTFQLYDYLVPMLRAHCAALASSGRTAISPWPAQPTAAPQPTTAPTPTSATSPTTAPPTSPPSTSGSAGGAPPVALETPTPVPRETTTPSLEPPPATADEASDGSSDAPLALLPPTTTTKPLRNASRSSPSSPASSSPTQLGSESNARGGATPWVLGIMAAAVSLTAAVLLARRRRQRKPSSAYATLKSPTTADDTASTKAWSAGNGTDDLLSADLRSRIDEKLENDAVLEAWRLQDTKLTNKRFLGRGSHAFVHLVELPDGTCMAAKTLAAGQISLANIEQLIHEAHTASTLQHRSIVSFVGVAWTSALDFQLLFEFMAGGDLRTYLDTHKPSPVLARLVSQATPAAQELETDSNSSTWSPVKLHMALSVAEGLAYAHSFNPPLVHRDLKSRNILLTKDLHAKISDFGVARFLSENDTMTTGIGTNRWLAPEVLAGGGSYTEKCDIYSFGVVLTELDTHEVPLASEMEMDAETGKRRTELSLMRGIARGELRPRMSASCPVVLRELAARCLSLDAGDRPNALELSYRLRSIASKQ